MKGTTETRGVVSSLVQHEDTRVGIQYILSKKCPNLGIFAVTCIIGGRTFTDAMLDLGASINVMPTSIYKSLNLGDLEPTVMESVVRPLGVLEDVLVQVNKLIFPADFYVLDMEDNASKGGFALILGQPFFMTTKTKIDVHAKTLSMEFGDTYIEFNIFEALKYPAEDHSTFSLDAIDGLMEEYFRLGIGIASLIGFIDKIDVINEFCVEPTTTNSEILPHTLPFSYFGDVISKCPRPSQYPELHTFNNSKLGVSVIVTLVRAKSDSRIGFREDKRTEFDFIMRESANTDSINLDRATIAPSSRQEAPSDSSKKTKGVSDSRTLLDKASQPTPPNQEYVSPQPQATKLQPLPEHLKQLAISEANNLHRDQEEKLLEVLRKHNKAIGWMLADLLEINHSICMHKILLEEDA
ncbi:hypothetical protein CR513_51199, partial [Mucuna pruriens]